jgi:RNA polymerase sigma-70 factor (ECF subfamily)
MELFIGGIGMERERQFGAMRSLPAHATGAGAAAGALRPAGAPGCTDEEIVRTVLGGDIDGFEEIIRRHQKPLVNFLYRMVGDLDLALDMAQEVFTKAYLALRRFDERFRFTTWLYRIASNNAIDHLRRHRPPTVSLDQPLQLGDGEVPFELPSLGSSPVEELQYRETSRRLSDGIGRLPASYRQILLLRHVRHLRYDEIAEVCDLPLGTVKNRIFRARLLLRRMLDGTPAPAAAVAESAAAPKPAAPRNAAPPRKRPAARAARTDP